MNQFKYPIGEHFVFESSIDTFVLEHGINVDDFEYIGEIMVTPRFQKSIYKVNFKKEVIIMIDEVKNE